MTAHALKMNGGVLVVGGQGGADRAQGDGGTILVTSVETGVGGVDAKGVDPQGAAGLPKERLKNLYKYCHLSRQTKTDYQTGIQMQVQQSEVA